VGAQLLIKTTHWRGFKGGCSGAATAYSWLAFGLDGRRNSLWPVVGATELKTRSGSHMASADRSHVLGLVLRADSSARLGSSIGAYPAAAGGNALGWGAAAKLLRRQRAIDRLNPSLAGPVILAGLCSFAALVPGRQSGRRSSRLRWWHAGGYGIESAT